MICLYCRPRISQLVVIKFNTIKRAAWFSNIFSMVVNVSCGSCSMVGEKTRDRSCFKWSRSWVQLMADKILDRWDDQLSQRLARHAQFHSTLPPCRMTAHQLRSKCSTIALNHFMDESLEPLNLKKQNVYYVCILLFLFGSNGAVHLSVK